MTGPEEQYVREKAGEVYSAHGVDLWMKSPNKLFGGYTPVQMLLRGKGQEVLDVIEMLASGATS